ncbi:MAG TPA: family 43 glycosylhydrolase [Sphingomonas sp.]|nr:family 43 glycosylhydrolase [Sphingomonas sp.]
MGWLNRRRAALLALGALTLAGNAPDGRAAADTSPTAVTTAQSESEIRAALKSRDRAIHVTRDWIRDPFIALGPDGYYYLTGTRPNVADGVVDPRNNGLKGHSVVGQEVRVYRSRDMASWAPFGTVYDQKDNYWYAADRATYDKAPFKAWRLWAPELHWVDGHWVIVHTTPKPLTGFSNLAISQGRELKGPWRSPMGEAMRLKHDPALFVDRDGSKYLLWGADRIAKIKPDFSGFASPETRIKPANRKMGHEGTFMLRIGEKYVYFGTGWSADKPRTGSYNLYYAVGDSPFGPFGDRRLAGRFLGHGTLFQDKDGRWWCTAFYNADTPVTTREQVASGKEPSTSVTINEQGVTIVPMDVQVTHDGDVVVRALDPAYAKAGPEEVQKF